MKIINLVVITLYFFQNGYSQEFTFDNYLPKWSFIVFDSSYIGHSEQNNISTYFFNGKNHLVPLQSSLIHEEKVITVFVNHKNDLQGGLIEVRNIENGKLQWSHSFDLRNEDQREYPAYYRINDRGNLDLLCFRSVLGDNYSLIWHLANISYREFDINNGTVLNAKILDPESPDSKELLFYPGRVSLIPSGNNFVYPIMESLNDSISQYSFISFNADLVFEREVTQTVQRSFQYFDSFSKFYPHNNYFYTTRHSVNEISPEKPPKAYEYSLNIYNENWDQIDSINLAIKLDSATAYEYLGVQHNYHIFVLINNFGQETPRKLKVSSLNETLDFIETVTLPQKEFSSYQIHKLPNENGMLIVATLKGESTIEFYKSDGNGNLVMTKTLTADNKFILPQIRTELFANKYMLFSILTRELDENRKIIEDKDQIISLAIDLEALNIISKTNQFISSNFLKIHPNPTNSSIHIQGLQEEAKVRIQHINGEVIKTVSTTDGQVDISDLPNGLYIFEIQNKHVAERHKVLKVE